MNVPEHILWNGYLGQLIEDKKYSGYVCNSTQGVRCTNQQEILYGWFKNKILKPDKNKHGKNIKWL